MPDTSTQTATWRCAKTNQFLFWSENGCPASLRRSSTEPIAPKIKKNHFMVRRSWNSFLLVQNHLYGDHTCPFWHENNSDGAVAPQARNFGTEYWSRAIFSISIGIMSVQIDIGYIGVLILSNLVSVCFWGYWKARKTLVTSSEVCASVPIFWYWI